jgi:hypothetical protein
MILRAVNIAHAWPHPRSLDLHGVHSQQYDDEEVVARKVPRVISDPLIVCQHPQTSRISIC